MCRFDFEDRFLKELGLRVDEMCMFPHIVSHGNVRLRWDCMKEVGVGLGLEGSEDVVANEFCALCIGE